MNGILKAAHVEKQAVNAAELALINKQALRELAAEEVFTFRMAACDNQVDRDHERFTDKALEGLAPLFVGKSVLMDHKWAAASQTARVYAADVETRGEIKQLVLRCYMPRSDSTAGTIAAIETGILRECSVGCAMSSAITSPGRSFPKQLFFHQRNRREFAPSAGRISLRSTASITPDRPMTASSA